METKLQLDDSLVNLGARLPGPALAPRTTPIRVLLADDHILFRRGIFSLLRSQSDIDVVGESGDGFEALDAARSLRPDLILMDVKMPRCNGIEATAMIKQEMPATRIIALTVSEDEEDLFHIIKNGAQGYLLKNVEPEDLFTAIRNASKGEASISPLMATKMLHEFSRQVVVGKEYKYVPSHLTEREKEVLLLIANGAGNSQISVKLKISESTARNHVHNILEKLHLRNRVQAAIYAIDHGLITRSSEVPFEEVK